MKYALILLIIIAAFGLGWVANAPKDKRPRSETFQADTVDEKAAARWRTKTRSMTSREAAEAIYRGTLEATPEERLLHLKQSNLRRPDLDDRIAIHYMVLSLNEDQILDALDSIKGNQSYSYLEGMLLRRWVELNLESAKARYLQDPEDPENRRLGSYVFANWSRQDMAGAINAIQQLPPTKQKEQMNQLIYRVMRDDPHQALELQLAYGSSNDYTYRNIFKYMAKQDPAVAWEKISTLPYAPYKRAVDGYFDALKEDDISNAFTQLDSIKDYDTQLNIRRSLYNEWFKQDTDAALASLVHERQPERVLPLWDITNEQAEAVMNWAQANLDGTQQDQIFSNALNQMIRNDPEQAKAYIDQLPYGGSYRSAMSQLIIAEFEREPDAAIARVQAMPNGQEKRDYLRSILNVYASNDWEGAKDFYATLDPQSQRDATYSLMSSAADQGSEAIIAALQDTDAYGEGGQQAKERLLQSWSSRDPWATFEYLGVEGFGQLEKEHQRTHLRNFARQSPSEAATWLDKVEEENRTDMTKTVAEAWLDHDPYEASLWISEMPSGESRDTAVESMVNEIRKSDPAAAFDWATGIENDEKRYNSARRIIRDWDDPAAAEDALLSSDLSDEEVERLMKAIKND